MWFKNLRIYRLSPDWVCSAEELEEALSKHSFTPGSSQEPLSLGWVSPRENNALVHEVNGQYLIALRAGKKLLPTTVINQGAREKARDIEEQQGYKVGRKLMKEIKERVTDELLPRAFSIYRDTRVWIDPINLWLVIDAATSS